MSNFLSWVYAQASKVYQWFGSSFQTLYNGAANAWRWAVEQANSAFDRAIDYAYSILQSIHNTILSYVGMLQARINDARNDLIDDITGLFDWVEYKFSNIYDTVRQYVNDLIVNVGEVVYSVQAQIENAINNSIAWVREWVNDSFEWVNEIRQALLNVITFMSSNTIQKLSDMVSTLYNTLLIFIQNPLGFMFDLMQNRILEFLSYVIAWALGTTIYELPARKTWKD